MGANERQVGGEHYRSGAIQHWDWAASEGLDYFQGAITKYVARWRKKGGIQDLKKAQHYLEKYIELMEHEERERHLSMTANAIRNNEPYPAMPISEWR